MESIGFSMAFPTVTGENPPEHSEELLLLPWGSSPTGDRDELGLARRVSSALQRNGTNGISVPIPVIIYTSSY